MLIASAKRSIMTALAARATAAGVFNLVETQKIRIMASDFLDHELPAAQFIGIGEEPQHQHNRILNLWVIHLEIVMKSTENGIANQYDLWDMQETMMALFGAQAQLRDQSTNQQIPGFLDINYRGTQTDLHMQEPYLTLRMELTARYYTDFTGNN